MMRIGIAVSLLLLACNGCSVRDALTNKPPVEKTIGPVKIATAIFDYHQTLENTDGSRFEFNHCGFVDDLSEVGATVNITYTGDYGQLIEDRGCAHVVKTVFVKHSQDYSQHHPETWPPRAGHWERDAYVLDAGGIVCGKITSYEEGIYRTHVGGEYSRSGEGVYIDFITKAAAKSLIEEDCK